MKLTVILLFASLLNGCASIQTLASKHDLDVQTKMSQSIFLDPIESESQKTIYLEVRNTSDKPGFQINSLLREELEKRGFKITTRSKEAQYVLQANVLQVGKSSPSAAESAMYRGYGADGALLGAGTAYVAGGSDAMVFGAGVAGGLLSTIADSVVKDVYYSAITDIRITKRAKTSKETYTTRVLSSANKVNLSFEDALPALKEKLSASIAGIFG